MELLWYCTAPDGRYPWREDGARTVDYAYFQQLARAVDHLGFTGALFATGPHDVWVAGSALIPYTERMKFLIAVHPGLISPVLLAKMAATFDQFSRGRLLINVVNGTTPVLRGYGLELSHDERYAHSDEYLEVYRRVLLGETVDYEGRYVRVRGGSVAVEPVQRPYPPLWFGGSSPAALDVAAKHINTYLTWGEPPPQTAEKVADLRRRAAAYGRTLRFGIRLYVIVRETEELAWAAADRLLSHMDDQSIDEAQRRMAGGDSEGQRRMSALVKVKRRTSVRDFEIYPNLWAGLGLIRSGPGTAIVGDPQTVAARMREYQAAGIDTFIISGIPLLEEAYRVSELLFPLLDIDDPRSAAGPITPETAPVVWNTVARSWQDRPAARELRHAQEARS